MLLLGSESERVRDSACMLYGRCDLTRESLPLLTFKRIRGAICKCEITFLRVICASLRVVLGFRSESLTRCDVV